MLHCLVKANSKTVSNCKVSRARSILLKSHTPISFTVASMWSQAHREGLCSFAIWSQEILTCSRHQTGARTYLCSKDEETKNNGQKLLTENKLFPDIFLTLNE